MSIRISSGTCLGLVCAFLSSSPGLSPSQFKARAFDASAAASS